LLARAAVRLLAGRPGPHIVHGFAIWSASAAAAAQALGRRGETATAVASAYATRTYEIGAMQNGLGPHLSSSQRLRYRAWLRWASLVDDRIEGWGYGNARVVLVNYRSVRRILASAYGEGLDVRLIPYAAASSFADIPGPRRAPAVKSLATEPPVILAISRHDPRKGIDLLLHALAGLAFAGIPFRAVLVGGGRLLEAHRRLAAELCLGHAVSIEGEVPDVDVYLRRADIYVLPSRAEASGSVAVLEALRSGVAVVASACDGIPEDLTDGRDAVLVAPGNAGALRDAIAALLADPQRRVALARAGRKRHDERFGASRLTDALGGVYAELGVAPAGAR
jgi:glycosyltransferase involved in cell wall biosynthesis